MKRTRAEAEEAMRERLREIQAENASQAAAPPPPTDREPTRSEVAILAHSIRVAGQIAAEAEARRATDGPDIG